MNTILEILFAPGGALGIIFLRTTCKLGLNFESMCVFDHGSGTSTGELIFSWAGAIFFYTVVLWLVIRYIQKRRGMDANA